MSTMGGRGDLWVLAVFIVVCLGAGGVGSLFTTPALVGWYPSLLKPVWTPPNQVFAPVWSTLYLLMAVAAWLVWRQAGFGPARAGLVLFAVQLLLNTAWSFLFFGLRNPGAGVVGIVALWVAIALTTAAFARINVRAAWLMAPYLGWVTFATALNVAIWRLNG